MAKPIRFILYFIFIMAFQVFILNNIVIKSALTLGDLPIFIPLIYPFIILILPVNTNHVLVMLISFFVGLTMDMFSNTPGMHAATCVLLGYMRPYLLNLFFQQNIKDLGDTVPTLYRMGFKYFLLYNLFALLVHHFFFLLTTNLEYNQPHFNHI
ncbi:MAG: membrane protein [Bacteroidetes bacterium OLB11]|nr:MAG: membrane protein [Bacteroidetes bacterium OLB11]